MTHHLPAHTDFAYHQQVLQKKQLEAALKESQRLVSSLRRVIDDFVEEYPITPERKERISFVLRGGAIAEESTRLAELVAQGRRRDRWYEEHQDQIDAFPEDV